MGAEDLANISSLPPSSPSLGHAPAQRQTLGPQPGPRSLAAEPRGRRRATTSPAAPCPVGSGLRGDAARVNRAAKSSNP